MKFIHDHNPPRHFIQSKIITMYSYIKYIRVQNHSMQCVLSKLFAILPLYLVQSFKPTSCTGWQSPHHGKARVSVVPAQAVTNKWLSIHINSAKNISYFSVISDTRVSWQAMFWLKLRQTADTGHGNHFLSQTIYFVLIKWFFVDSHSSISTKNAHHLHTRDLTHNGIVTPYGDIKLGQHWSM